MLLLEVDGIVPSWQLFEDTVPNTQVLFVIPGFDRYTLTVHLPLIPTGQWLSPDTSNFKTSDSRARNRFKKVPTTTLACGSSQHSCSTSSDECISGTYIIRSSRRRASVDSRINVTNFSLNFVLAHIIVLIVDIISGAGVANLFLNHFFKSVERMHHLRFRRNQQAIHPDHFTAC